MRQLIDTVTKLICWIKRNRMIKLKSKIVKVNLGSGLSVAENWINVDVSLNTFFSGWPRFVLKMLYRISGSNQLISQEEYCDILKNHIFICHNVCYGIPFPNDSVDYLYSSHLLEHLSKENAKKLVREAYRVLKKSGIIRICVPNLEYAILLYQKGDKEKALDYFFASSKSNYFSRHRGMYDFDLLRHLLEESGFINVERCYYRHGQIPNLDILDNRPEETLYVEARK